LAAAPAVRPRPSTTNGKAAVVPALTTIFSFTCTLDTE
jgi:hypothetical protein